MKDEGMRPQSFEARSSQPTPIRAGEDAGREAARYTVVYEGSPLGCRILNGEPAVGRAVSVMLGDMYAAGRSAEARAFAAEAEVVRLTQERDAAAAGSREMNRLRAQSGAEASALRERVARLEEAIRPFSDLGTKEGRRGRLAFEDTDEDQDVVNTKGRTFDEVSDAFRVVFEIEAGNIRRARAALTEGAPTDV